MRLASFLALLLFLKGCASQPIHREAVACESPQVLYVVRHGGHAGVVVSRGDLVELLPSLARDIGHEGYVEIGWGEERFYQAGTGTLGLALRAILWPNSSVLQVVPFTGPPHSHFPQSEVVEVRVEKAGYAAALAFIAGSFTPTPDGGVARLGPSQYGNGWFYRAQGSFHAFNTCNTWVARAIEKTGYPVSSTLTLTAEGLLSQLRDGANRCDPSRALGRTPPFGRATRAQSGKSAWILRSSGRITTPFSVKSALTSSAGVMSKAGLATLTPSGAQRMPA
jgi:uncharacterized protein (TIGR02117 family)